LEEEIFNERREWYSNPDVLFQIVNQLKDRETAFYKKVKDQRFAPARWLKCHTAQYLLQNMIRYEFFQEPMNLYYSVARYKTFPTMSFNLSQKPLQQEDWNETLNENPDAHVNSYDLFIDIDNPDLTKAHNDMLITKRFLEEHNLPIMVSFSGNKGFHIELKTEFIPSEIRNLPINYQVFLQRKIIRKLKDLLLVESIDESIYDLKRICKTKFSYDVTSGLICLPLTDYECEHFNKSIVKPEHLLSYPRRIKMGLLIDDKLKRAENYHDIVLKFYTEMLGKLEENKEEGGVNNE